METMPNSKPSFYKILMDISPELGLPKGFMEKYGEMLPTNVNLRIACGTTWKVKMEKLKEDDCYLFTRGWTKFSQDMKLKIFELLVFSYVGKHTFDVSVYATTALEKRSDFKVRENPGFQMQFKDYHYYKIHAPEHFCKELGLVRKQKVVFEYSGGKSGYVSLNPSQGRLDIGAGWSRFWKANGLTFNKTYSFEFLRSKNILKVQPHDSAN